MDWDKDFIEVGHSKKTYGVRGEVRVNIYDHFKTNFHNLKFIFLKMDGLPVPWQIEHWKTEPIECIKFADINDPESAHPMTGKPMYAHKKDLPESLLVTESDALEYGHLVGFEVYTMLDPGSSIGIIHEIQNFPNQEMAIIKNTEGRERLIPLVPDYIAKIDASERKIIFDLPEGFLELT